MIFFKKKPNPEVAVIYLFIFEKGKKFRQFCSLKYIYIFKIAIRIFLHMVRLWMTSLPTQYVLSDAIAPMTKIQRYQFFFLFAI